MISPSETLIAGAIDRFTLATRDDDNRKHLGASIIGRECKREVWYKFRWAKKETFEPRMLRLFGRGHREEPEFIRLLRGAGVTVYDAGENGENKEAMRISDHDGHFGGTPDAVGTNLPGLPEDMAVLLEFKTFNYDQFQKLKKDKLMRAKWVYYIQMLIYMEKHGLTLGLFMAVCKDDDEIYYEYIHANPEIAQTNIRLAGTLIHSETPPRRISESPGWYECRYCSFLAICHQGDIPATNCRTCAHGTPGPNATWLCARSHEEVGEQRGCSDHLYDPRWFDNWRVIDGDFDSNWILVDNGTEQFRHGPNVKSAGVVNAYTSEELFRTGLVPF